MADVSRRCICRTVNNKGFTVDVSCLKKMLDSGKSISNKCKNMLKMRIEMYRNAVVVSDFLLYYFENYPFCDIINWLLFLCSDK